MNLFTEKPEVSEVTIPSIWTCPKTGLTVPNLPDTNLVWREKILVRAQNDRAFQQDLYTACSQSILFWIKGFCWTFRLWDTEGNKINKNVPFVTWPVQDEHITAIEGAIDGGTSLATDKARELGATWNHTTVLTHRLLFRRDESHLMVSRREDAVDILTGSQRGYPYESTSDPGTLFGKIDYVLARLPVWMLGRLNRKKLHLVNLDSGSRIDGESSNGNVGVSDRRTSLFLDEFALVEEAESIKRVTRDVTPTRLVCSTPAGPGTTYTKWILSGTIPVFDLPWWKHPEKCVGIYTAQDELGRWKIRSKWYDREVKVRSPKEVATQIDQDHLGSGEQFFEPTSLEQHKRLFVSEPKYQCHVLFQKNLTDEIVIRAVRGRDIEKVQISRNIGGPWKIWRVKDDGRPDQNYHYIFGIDVSRGYGASNSAITIICAETHEIIAQFANNSTPPYELARLVCAAAIWCGGQNRVPEIIFESNGTAGVDFGRQLRHYEYPNIWLDKTLGVVTEKNTKHYGFHSTTDKKAALLGLLRRAYAHGRIVNHSIDSIAEAMQYIHLPDGSIGPASDADEKRNVRADHGDRVIADALALWACPNRGYEITDDREIPYGSFAWRMRKHLDEVAAERARKKREWWNQ
jgi:hypothetical protein